MESLKESEPPTSPPPEASQPLPSTSPTIALLQQQPEETQPIAPALLEIPIPSQPIPPPPYTTEETEEVELVD